MPQAFDIDVGGTIELCNSIEPEPLYWRNDFNYLMYIREIMIWQGISQKAIIDAWFGLWLVRNEQNDVQLVHKGSWDHYAEPTNPNHTLIKTYNPHYALMPPKAYFVFRRKGTALNPDDYDKSWHHQIFSFWYTLEP